MKTIFLLMTLMLLVSCTHTPVTPTSPVLKGEIQKEDAMMKKNMLMSGAMMDKTMSGAMMDKTMSGMPDDMIKKESMTESKMMKPTGYASYDEMSVKNALTSGQKVALFFHAAWCPTCRALDKAINSDLASIPSDTLIVKVDYDTSVDMKKKYGVTSQHTTVLIDKDMALISKKIGAKTVGEVLN